MALVIYELTWAADDSEPTTEIIHASSYWADETEDGSVLKFWDVDSPNAGRNPDPNRPLDTPIRVVEADEHEDLLGLRVLAAPDAPESGVEPELEEPDADGLDTLDRMVRDSEQPSNVAHVVLTDPEPDEG